MRWHDGSDGHGEHYFDFNHGGSEAVADYSASQQRPLYGSPQPQGGGYAAPTLEIELAENRISDFENLQPFQPSGN